MSDDNENEESCAASVNKLYHTAMSETDGDVHKALEVLVKTMLLMTFVNSKTGCERRALVQTQKVVNEMFDDGIAALDKDLRRMAVGGDE